MPSDGKQEKWWELCAQAAKEENPQKMIALVEEINRLLLEKEANSPKFKTED